VSLLSELSGFLQACPRAEEGYACIADYGPRLFPGSLGALYLLEDAGDTLVEKAFWGHAIDSGTRASRFGSGECWALRRGQPYRVDSPSSALCCPHVDRLTGNHRPYSCVPLLAQGKTFGLLFVEHRRQPVGHALDVPQDLVLAMAEHAGLALANIRLREALLQQSIRDPLTGLYNRRHLHEFLQLELARSQRAASELSVMMVDVDHFKQFNDTFGHQAGDEVLQSVARLIETLFRGHDIGCRYGGEEFILLLPGCSSARARERAIDLLDAVRSLRLTHEDRVLGRITASIGLAQFPQDGDTPGALIAAADAALYEAKAAGRDRLAISVTSGAR
jgi:diguanylate cyclase (GGDEF)-like protein